VDLSVRPNFMDDFSSESAACLTRRQMAPKPFGGSDAESSCVEFKLVEEE